METETKTYQGWKNYETWNCKLWLDNDASLMDLQSEWKQQAKDSPIKSVVWTKEQNTRYILADLIKDFIEENNPLANDANMYTDLLQSAIDNIDFNEIAENILSED
jgi:hypothetical protein